MHWISEVVPATVYTWNSDLKTI